MTHRSWLIVSGSFYPREGGAERQLRQVFSSIANDGDSVSVVTQQLEGQERDRVVEGINLRSVSFAFLFRRFPRVAQIVYVGHGTLRAVLASPDVFVSTQLGGASIIAAFASRFRRRRHILRLTGGAAGVQGSSEPLRRQERRSSSMVMRLALSSPDLVVIAPAQHLLTALSEVTRRSFESAVLPNGALRAASSVREEVVTYYYRHSAKNADDFRELASATPHVDYRVIGPDDPEIDLGNVQWVGWVSEPELLFAAAAASVSTSLAEGSPNAARQALANGCRFVGYEVDGHRDLGAEENGVYLVQPSDIENLATAVNSALLDAAANRPLDPLIPTIDDVVEKWQRIAERGRQDGRS